MTNPPHKRICWLCVVYLIGLLVSSVILFDVLVASHPEEIVKYMTLYFIGSVGIAVASVGWLNILVTKWHKEPGNANK